ncbi:hypothetical protein CHS0354_026011 [Potamilus streckersoni]|uniref:Uncharacterized protein n=1 Tax=Potamilus streckersoni TaxID=2493646 RepID=A0AAE0VM59_9BIVA|nr:hypothetical protein CHS0354_026011 [Potamilus streckersoni]
MSLESDESDLKNGQMTFKKICTKERCELMLSTSILDRNSSLLRHNVRENV